MVITFVRSAGNNTRELWRFLEEVRRTDIGLAELEHPSFNKMLHQCTGRVPIYVHPCFYRALKLRYPMNVGGISRDGRVTNLVSVPCLRLSASSFRRISRPLLTLSKVNGTDGFKPCHVECEGTEEFKQVCTLACWTHKPLSVSNDLSRPQKELYRELVVGSASDLLSERRGWTA